MSSLLQFSGEVTRKGVHLRMYRTIPSETPCHKNCPSSGEPAEPVRCSRCGETHPRLYIAVRKPVGMFGCWVVFRLNGKEEVPDLSVPIAMFKLPRDAKPVSDADNERLWHS